MIRNGLLYYPRTVAAMTTICFLLSSTAAEAWMQDSGTPQTSDQTGEAPAQNSSVPAQISQGQTDKAPISAAGNPIQNTLTDIVVTAQRREERLQDVPISITALTGADLEKQNIGQVQDLYGAVPNVWMGFGIADPTDIQLGIRGLGGTAVQQSVTDAPVGIYVDGVYRARTGGSNVSMIDMERVEVLKGPQGTLFGRNTIGGAFNITTKQPTDQFEGSLTADVGNYAKYGGTAIVNMPIVPGVLDGRLVYQHSQRDGYGYNAYLDQRVGSINQDYVRGSLKLTATPNLTLTLSGDHLDVTGTQLLSKTVFLTPNSTNNAAVPAAQGHPGDLISNYIDQDFRTTLGEHNYPIYIRTNDVTGTVVWDLGGATLKSITAYRDLDEDVAGDVDGEPYIYHENPSRPFSYHQFSEELQLFGTGFGDRLHWIGGLYYLTEHDRKGVYSTATVGVSPNASLQDSFADNRNYAVFGQLDFEVVHGLTLTGGLRWTEDERSIDYRDQIVNNATGIKSCAISIAVRNDPAICRSAPPTAKYHYWPYTVGVRYELNSNATFYAKLSEGFRSGGFSQTAPAQPIGLLPFAPEKLLSPEIGSKLTLLGGRLRVNAAAYYSKYSDVQVSTNGIDPASGVNILVTRNLGNARIYGGELEGEGLIGRLELRGSFGLAKAKYTAGPSIAPPYLPPYPFVNSPTYTATGGASLPLDTGFGQITLNANYNWRSFVYFYAPSTVNLVGRDVYTQKAYGLLNANIDFALNRFPGVKLTIWGNNLTNKKYIWRAADYIASAQDVVIEPGDPMTFGATLSYKF